MSAKTTRWTAGLAAGALLAGGLAVMAPTAAQARYAQGGTGQYQNVIDWFEWGTPNEDIPAEGITRVNTRQVAGQELVTTCVVGPTSNPLRVQRPGTFVGDGLDDMYNIGGTGTNNQLISGLANVNGGEPVSFDFDCSVTLDGVAVPLAGLVMADAEASLSNEYIEATIPEGADWRIFDRYRTPGCGTDTANTRTGQTLRIQGSVATGSADCPTFPTTVAFMDGASSADVTIQGGGRTAIALGVVLFSDYGDAPASYGDAGALYSPGFDGGVVPQGASGTFATSLATPAQPDTRLGAAVTPENASQPSAGANTDGADDGVVLPASIPVVPGTQYTLEDVSCTGPGFVSGWIDWNKNGTFDENEASALAECTGGSVDLTFDVPEDSKKGSTFLRLRIAADAAAAALPTGFATSGEVEDHAVVIALPEVDIEKTSTLTTESRPGDVVTFTVSGTNNSADDFTEDYPAVVFDDLSAVLDDATLVPGSLRATIGGVDAGPVSQQGTILSWTGPLAVGQTVVITYDVTLGNAGDHTVRNVAWQPVDPNDPTPPACDPRNEDGTDPVTGERCGLVEVLLPSLDIDKVADTTELPAVGQTVTFTVTATNTGPGVYTDDAPAYVVDDLTGVLDDATIDEATLSASTGDAPTLENGRIIWSGALAVGETVTLTYEVTYTAAGDAQVTNVAFGPFDPPTPNDPSPTCLPRDENGNDPVTGQPCGRVDIPGAQLTVTKDVTPGDGEVVVTGDELTYTITFANTGNADAAVDYRDDMSRILDDAEIVTAPVASSDDLTVSDAVDGIVPITGIVPVGETVTVTYTVRVLPLNERGDSILGNFVLKPGDPPVTPETVCAPGDPLCTSNLVSEVVDSKSVNPASGTDVAPGQQLTYTLTFKNLGTGAGPVNRVDDLTHVLDDAAVISAPVSSDPALSASAVEGNRFAVTGTLAAGQTVTVTYTVQVNAAGSLGDARLGNFLLDPDQGPPPTPDCVEGSEDCTSNLASDVLGSKSSDPASGTAVNSGSRLTYTLTFTNSGTASGVVDFTDHMAGVLDDAVLVGTPVSSSNTVKAVLEGQTLQIDGTLEAGATATVQYVLEVRAWSEQGDHSMGNFLTYAGQQPPAECSNSIMCTVHKVTPPSALASTGAEFALPAGLLAAMLFALGAGFMVFRRTRVAGEDVDA